MDISNHAEIMDKKRIEVGGDFISEGIVICVYDSAFDVLISEYGFENRVHCDQLPFKESRVPQNRACAGAVLGERRPFISLCT